MSLKTLAVASAIVLLLAGPQIVMAKSIKEKLAPQQVTEFCTTNGVGEKPAQITMPDGTVVTGTIDCESENVAGIVPTDASSAPSIEDGKGDLSASSQEDDNQGANHDQGDDHSATASGDHSGGGNGGGDD